MKNREDITIDGYKPKEGDVGYHRCYGPCGRFKEFSGVLFLHIYGYGIEKVKDSIFLPENRKRITKPGPWLKQTKKEYNPE